MEALVEATARVLVKEGYDRASTNRIAAVAGVSIGSLYQYFPGKEALVAAVRERHAEKLAKVVGAALREAVERPLDLAVRDFVKAAIEAHRVERRLHRVLAEELPQVGRGAEASSVLTSGHAFIRTYLETHRDELAVADPDLAAFLVVTTVEALTHAAVLHRADLLAEEKAEAFVDETARLLLRYLRPSPPT